MALKKSFPVLVAVSLLCAPLTAQAQTNWTDQVIDGGTCIPYPPSTSTGLNWQHWLFGFSGTAFCHLTMTQDWPLNTLQYVVFTGWSGGTVTARLCVHSWDSAVACGTAATISGPLNPFQTNFVTPPTLPPQSHGAFVQFNFPSNIVSGVIELIPVWSK
jgi:hypothetical protein